MAKGPDYKKIAKRGTSPGKQIARDMVPSIARSPTVGPAQRSITSYAKNTPADASGKGQIGLNIFSMGRNK
jgi:hypothetical protein